ncbi:MAG: DNRLRE domain-containing protein [Verrucomicrobiota bacterium]
MKYHLVALLSSMACITLSYSNEAIQAGKRVEPSAKQQDPALLAVEEDQATSMGSITNLANRDLLLGRYPSYAHCSTYSSGRFPSLIQDGNPRSGWHLPTEKKEGWVDASLGLLTTYDKIIVREAGAKILSYELKAYDGNQWVSLAQGNELGTKVFLFKPSRASAFRMEIKSNGGGGINALEVYNTLDPNSAFPEGPSPELRSAFADGGRIAMLLESPYAFAENGTEPIDKRNPEVRPLPASNPYLKEIISFLMNKLGGKMKWDEAGITLKADLNRKKFTFSLGSEDGVDDFKRFLELAGISMSSSPDFPGLVLFGPPLTTSTQPALFKELHSHLSKSGGIHSRGGVSQGTGEPDAIVTPLPTVIGRTMPWVGARASTLDPGSNEAAWLNYIRPNAVRTWNGASIFQRYIPKDYPSIKTLEDFEKLKAAVRSDPEGSELMRWEDFMKSTSHAGYVYEYGVLNRLGITVVNQTGPKIWPDDWGNNFKNWLMTYMGTYYLAKHYGVEVHQYGNEPDSLLVEYPDEILALKLQLVSDAVHCAIEDVNLRHNKKLKAQYSAPVLAGTPLGKVARVMMRNLRTDYRGKSMDRDLVQYFNRHRYNNRPRQNVEEIDLTNRMMLEESATGKALPQIFTELNYSTGGNWARPQMNVTNDSPVVFCSLASIWGQMMATQKVQGIFLFKLYGPSNQWSNTVCYEFVKESDSQKARYLEKGDKADVGYSSKNAEILRIFSEGFSHGRPLLKTGIECADMHFQAYTSFDPLNQTYHLWTVQPNDTSNYEIGLDLSKLDVSPGAKVVIREVSDGAFGEVIFQGPLPANRKLRLIQPKESAWLVSIPKHAGPEHKDYAPLADATVRQGSFAGNNYGDKPTLRVQRHSKTDNNHVSFIKFRIDDLPKDGIHKALLRVHGKRLSEYDFDDSFVFRVYGMVEDDWKELEMSAENAPGICKTVSAVRRGVTTIEAPPVGHMSFTNKPGFSEIDVTHFVKDHKGRELTFLLIRELKLPDENTDLDWAELDSREGKAGLAPRLQIIPKS